MRRVALLCVASVLSACMERVPAPPASTVSPRLEIEALIDITHPSEPVWSPESARVAFVVDRAGVANLYVAGAAGADPGARALTDYTEGGVGATFWSADGTSVYFMRDGDLWTVPAAGGAADAVWSTPDAETGTVASRDVTRVAFVRPAAAGGGVELRTRSLADGRETVLARDAESIGAISWSPDGAHLAYAAGARAIRHDQTPAYSGAKIIYTVTERVPGQHFVVSAGGGTPVPIGSPGGGTLRWVDAERLVLDRQSPDFKSRTVQILDRRGAGVRVVHEETDDKFWSIPGGAAPAALPSPDGRWIALLSDRDGWDHLYVIPVDGGEATQLTRGSFEVWRPAWSPDSTRIAFDANEPDRPGTRHLGVVSVSADPAGAAAPMITSGRGTHTAPQWSPDGTRLVYQGTTPQHPADLFVVPADAGASAVRLSRSLPAAIDDGRYVEPEFVRYPGPDGQLVPGWLFVPPGLDRTRTHPAIVWIHGDGVNQGYDGWHVQRNYAVYYSFHQYLLERGYVVFAPDYRGSIGYGRAWRQGVYMDVGGQDARDAWMAADYLRTLGYVDMDRVGVWGLSYGGFFTLIAMTDQPTLFRAGVNVAGVVDYAMYYEDPYHGGWTRSRIGTPEENPEVYRRASPLSNVGRLARPLLTLHGTADVNVPYLHSVRLVDELLRQGKGELTTFMSYPGEFHYFTRAHVLRDAWTRVAAFFEAHLRQGRAATDAPGP
ncbi:MAG: prolyl oligopeptidase family serine peptidase [Vicinamibacterales bacterium]|nr:prolyl oligopeptidase family serine peptidase [Vicinamibacterales bacterium]